ncbi:MAG: zinc metallopeptidase [Bacilli bacterium]
MQYGGYGLLIIGMIITLTAQFLINKTYKKYSQVNSKNKLSGFEVARKILDENGLKNIYVTETAGVLTDHYDPTRKVVRLSQANFNGTTISAIAVSAHEVGHAIQDKNNYIFLKIRSFIFPITSFASKFGYFVITIGFIFGLTNVAWIGIGLLLFVLLFQLVTLPVEINASKNALEYLKKYHILEPRELEQGQKVLSAAAFTYVASLATTLLEILRLFIINKDNN